MAFKDQPKWQRPIDRIAAALGVRVDPALGVNEETVHLLEHDPHPMK
jgi:hypothetical protein